MTLKNIISPNQSILSHYILKNQILMNPPPVFHHHLTQDAIIILVLSFLLALFSRL